MTKVEKTSKLCQKCCLICELYPTPRERKACEDYRERGRAIDRKIYQMQKRASNEKDLRGG